MSDAMREPVFVNVVIEGIHGKARFQEDGTVVMDVRVTTGGKWVLQANDVATFADEDEFRAWMDAEAVDFHRVMAAKFYQSKADDAAWLDGGGDPFVLSRASVQALVTPPEQPVPLTQDEKVAFRKAWGAIRGGAEAVSSAVCPVCGQTELVYQGRLTHHFRPTSKGFAECKGGAPYYEVPDDTDTVNGHDTPADTLLYQAWVVIANVSGGDWEQQTPEWHQAATRWRDDWHTHLALVTPPDGV